MTRQELLDLLGRAKSLKVKSSESNPVGELDLPKVVGVKDALRERNSLLNELFGMHGTATYWSPNARSFGRSLVSEKLTETPDSDDKRFGIEFGCWCLFFPALSSKDESVLSAMKFDIETLVILSEMLSFDTAIASHEDDIQWTIWVSEHYQQSQ